MKKLIASLVCIFTFSTSQAVEVNGGYEFKPSEIKTPHYKLFNSVDKMYVYKKSSGDNIKCWIEFEKEGVRYSTTPELTTSKKFKVSPVRSCMKVSVAASYL